MTLREIFGRVIDYDLNPNFQIGFGVLIYIVAPIGLFWLGRMMLADALSKEQPHDRDLIGRVSLFLFGAFSIGGALFIWWDIIKHFL